MKIDLMLAIAPLLGLAVQAFIHIVLSRIFTNSSPWRLVFIGFCAGLLSTITFIIILSISCHLSNLDLISQLLVDAGAMVSLGFGYFTFINLNYSSLRIRLMREFINRGGILELPDILQQYNAETILKARLGRLIQAGELVFDGHYYRPGTQSRFSKIGAVVNWFKQILRIRPVDC
jgi:hypothetical protein